MLKVQKKKCRVHSLTGRIDQARLHKAFKAVKKNRGAAGIDKQSIEMFESNLEQNLQALEIAMKRRTYQPKPVRRKLISKTNGKLRALGIPIVRDRVAQEVVRSLINPIFEKIFHDCSHGFRNRHSCHTAMKQLLEYKQQGYRFVVDADIKGYFDSIPHKLILDMVAAEISDGNILELIRKFLQAGVMEDGKIKPTYRGTPQGGVISPLLANVVLNHLDWILHENGLKFVRYADDFVVLCKTKHQAEKAHELIAKCVEIDLELELNKEKTKISSFKEGFQFLGFHITSHSVRMSDKAVENFKNKIRIQTVRSHNLDAEVVEKINRIVRGTVNYFHTEFTTNLYQFSRVDFWLRKRIRSMKFKRIWRTDNTRMKNKHIKNKGFLMAFDLCKAKATNA